MVYLFTISIIILFASAILCGWSIFQFMTFNNNNKTLGIYITSIVGAFISLILTIVSFIFMLL